MTNERRLQVYLRDVTYPTDEDGYYRLTPKQRRRAEKKMRRDIKHRATSEYIAIYDEMADVPDGS